MQLFDHFTAYHTEIIRDSSKLNRALVDEEYSLSNQIVQIAKSMMEGGENCDLNAIASVMEEYKEVSLSNKTGKLKDFKFSISMFVLLTPVFFFILF